MRKIFVVLALLLLATFAFPQQNTLTPTYTTAAVTATQNTIPVYSATGITAGALSSGTVGSLLFIGTEAMRVQSISGTTLSVRRGTDGTVAVAHISGEAVYYGAPNLFYQSDPAGTCTAASTLVAPYINVAGARIWTCSSLGFWGANQMGSFPVAITTVANTAYTALISDFVIEYTSLTSSRAVTLPAPARCPGKVYFILDGAGGATSYNITLAATAINGSTTANCATSNYTGCRVISTGASWFTF